jgi:hypothetical protein
VKESNPTNKINALKPNKADGDKVRGFTIVAQYGQIRQIEAHTFKVKSQSGNGQYVITNGKAWDCTYSDHTYRRAMCKHNFAVKF